MKVLLAGWESYLGAVIPVTAGSVQREECRRAFYAGAQVLFEALQVIGGEEVSEEQGQHVLASVADELEQFPASVIAYVPSESGALGAIADMLTALDRIATRIPVKPFPDPGAHGWEGYATAVQCAYTDCVNVARRVLREFPVEAWEQIVRRKKGEQA